LLLAQAATAITSAAFAGQAIIKRFDSYVVEEDRILEERLQRVPRAFADILALYYAQRKTWGDVQLTVEDLANSVGVRVILTDPDGYVVADSDTNAEIGRQIQLTPTNDVSPYIIYAGEIVGVVTIQIKERALPSYNLGQQEYINSVNPVVLIAVVITGTLSIGLVLLYAHPILKTIESLTNAAGRMAQGDLTQRVEIHSRGEIGQLGHSFNQMADSLERIERLRRNMVTDIAHELRTPLSSIQGYMEGLRDTVIEPTSPLFESLHDETLLLGRLVNDLQDLALAEAGQLRLNRRHMALQDIIARAVHAMRPRANDKAITLIMDAPNKPLTIYADENRVDQMLRNLLKNAIAYTPEGGAVTASIVQENDVVTISVADTGPGIEAKHLPYLFERFYRADPSRTRATGGSGLGLAIVKQLAEAHGGSVWVDSSFGHGSTFAFVLPLNNRSTETNVTTLL
jgi:two-component system OmpR family sensor kinase